MIALALSTSMGHTIVGSNPTPSATQSKGEYIMKTTTPIAPWHNREGKDPHRWYHTDNAPAVPIIEEMAPRKWWAWNPYAEWWKSCKSWESAARYALDKTQTTAMQFND